jgi:hypothetical protein
MRIAWRTVGDITARVVTRHGTPIDWTKESGRILRSKEGRSAATLEVFFVEIGPEACARIRHAELKEWIAWAGRSRLARLLRNRLHHQPRRGAQQ